MAKTNALNVLTKYDIGKNSTENQFKFVALTNSLYSADVGVILKTLFLPYFKNDGLAKGGLNAR